MSKLKLINGLKKVKKTILIGLDTSFEDPNVYEKYIWLKEQYNQLTILETELPRLFDLKQAGEEFNVHFRHADFLTNGDETSN